MSSLKIQKAKAQVLYRCTAHNKVSEDSRVIFFHVTREHCAFSISLFSSCDHVNISVSIISGLILACVSTC